MGTQYGFNHDENRCIGCQSCQVACKQFHDIKAGTISYRNVSDTFSGTYPDVSRVFLNVSCQHCGNPPCIAACPVKAISKRDEDGIVVADQSKCIGCRKCFSACPFGAPKYLNGVMHKCDFCLSLKLEEGSQRRCAASCVTGALRSGSVEELTRQKIANNAIRRSRFSVSLA